MKNETSKPRVPVDKEAWSPKSKNTYSYIYAPTEYEDITYSCWNCGHSAVYSAEDQKRAFEVYKAHIDQGRKFCQLCWEQERVIVRHLRQMATEWKTKKVALGADREFLQSWLTLLERHADFGVRPNKATIAMLKKRIQAAAQQNAPEDALKQRASER